jgi:hypothetical protein
VTEEVIRQSSLLGIVKTIANIPREEERVTSVPTIADPEERIIPQSIMV